MTELHSKILIGSMPNTGTTTVRRQLYAGAMSVVFLFAALLLLWMGHLFPDQPTEEITVRQVTLVAPPPNAPPPSVVQQSRISPILNVQVQGSGSSVEMASVEQQIKISRPETLQIKMQPSQWQSLVINWDAFSLNDLDGLPNLLTPLRVTFPKSLSRQGILSALIKLDVMIDEQGRVSLVNIVENPYPELVAEIQRLVRDSRFSAPQKNNQPVRARFIWPVEIEA